MGFTVLQAQLIETSILVTIFPPSIDNILIGQDLERAIYVNVQLYCMQSSIITLFFKFSRPLCLKWKSWIDSYIYRPHALANRANRTSLHVVSGPKWGGHWGEHALPNLSMHLHSHALFLVGQSISSPNFWWKFISLRLFRVLAPAPPHFWHTSTVPAASRVFQSKTCLSVGQVRTATNNIVYLFIYLVKKPT